MRKWLPICMVVVVAFSALAVADAFIGLKSGEAPSLNN